MHGAGQLHDIVLHCKSRQYWFTCWLMNSMKGSQQNHDENSREVERFHKLKQPPGQSP